VADGQHTRKWQWPTTHREAAGAGGGCAGWAVDRETTASRCLPAEGLGAGTRDGRCIRWPMAGDERTGGETRED
jgi:hypothetical protein